MSPLTALLLSWWNQTPKPYLLNRLREELYRTAADEVKLKADAGLTYDPNADRRFLWALQLLDVANGTRHRVDLAVRDAAAFLLGVADPSPSAQSAAANDTE